MENGHKVAVIGASGALGFGLAARLVANGTSVVVGSRSGERAQQVAGELSQYAEGGAVATGATNAEAADSSQIVFLTVPFAAQLATLKEISGSLAAGDILVDATAPLEAAVGGPPTRPLTVWSGSAAQQAAAAIPEGVTVVSALHTVSAKTLKDLDSQIDENTLLCGDNTDAKKSVAEILSLIPGLRPVNCGPLEMARITEQLTPLLIAVNKHYKTKHSGLKITGLPEELW